MPKVTKSCGYKNTCNCFDLLTKMKNMKESVKILIDLHKNEIKDILNKGVEIKS